MYVGYMPTHAHDPMYAHVRTNPCIHTYVFTTYVTYVFTTYEQHS